MLIQGLIRFSNRISNMLEKACRESTHIEIEPCRNLIHIFFLNIREILGFGGQEIGLSESTIFHFMHYIDELYAKTECCSMATEVKHRRLG